MRIAGLVAAAAAALVLCGWAFDLPMLRSPQPGMSATEPLTAVCVLAAGAALWLSYPRPKSSRISPRCGQFLGALAIALAGFSLAQDVAGVSPAGRMPPLTAAALVFLGFGIIALTFRRTAHVRAGQIAALVAAGLSAIAVVGYIYGLDLLPRLGASNAAAFLIPVLSGATLAARPDAGLTAVVSSQGPGGWLARRGMPFAVAIPLLLGWVRLWGQRRGAYGEIGPVVFALSTMTMFAALIWFAARWLNRLEMAAADATEDLRRANESLERRVAERTVELQDALDRVETAERHRALFLAQMSHDLRTPLNAILGFTRTQLMGLAGPLTGEQRDQLRLIDDNGRQLLAFIDALLETVHVGAEPTDATHDQRQDRPAAETGA